MDGCSSFVGTNLKVAAEFPHPLPHTCDSYACFGSGRIQPAEPFLIHTFAIVSNLQLELMGIPVKPDPGG
jgi:hypothetical protein